MGETWLAHFGPIPIGLLCDKNRPYFKKSLILKLNNSKTYHQILTSFTALENIDQTTFVEHIADMLRLPVRTSRQPQCKKSVYTDFLHSGCLYVRTGDLKMSEICSTNLVYLYFPKLPIFSRSGDNWVIYLIKNVNLKKNYKKYLTLKLNNSKVNIRSWQTWQFWII